MTRHGLLVTTITAGREGILGGLSGAHIMGGYDVAPQGNYDSAAPSSIFNVRLRLRLWASHFSRWTLSVTAGAAEPWESLRRRHGEMCAGTQR